MWKWIVGVPVALFVAFLTLGAIVGPSKSFEQRKQECAKAMMSSIGHSTRGYADKAAYDAHVREHCEGLELNGVPLGK